MTEIAVLGAGSWGTTLADLLARKGNAVRLWAYEPDVVEAVNRRRENPLFLPGVKLHEQVRACNDAREAVAGGLVGAAQIAHLPREIAQEAAVEAHVGFVQHQRRLAEPRDDAARHEVRPPTVHRVEGALHERHLCHSFAGE